jgi:hypothetical protein
VWELTLTADHSQPSKPVDPSDEVEIHIVFDYLIQITPTRTNRRVLTESHDLNVLLKLSRKNLDDRGYPHPQALWFAERMFLKAFNDKHLPDVRMLQWKAHVKGDTFVLSEYSVSLSCALD